MAFEPSPSNYEILTKNVEKNGLKNVESFKLAISDKEVNRELLTDEHSDNCSFYNHSLTGNVGKVIVKTMSLDHIVNDLPNRPIIIKIGVEGHELAVLAGMENLLKKVENVELFIEFDPKKIIKSGHKPEDLLSKIDHMGFDIFFIEDEKRETYKIKNTESWVSFFNDENHKKGYFNILCAKKERSLSMCIFSHSAELYGAERSLLELTRELIANYRAQCTVILPEDGPLRSRLAEAGIRGDH